MYEKYYGLSSRPFDLIPDPDVVYMSEAHQEALAILRYGVMDRKGFLLLTGGVGTGKTTLLQRLRQSLDNKVHLCLIANPTLSVNDFYYYLSAKYGLPEYDGNKARFMLTFADFLQGCRERDERVLLIIDEAHVLPVDLLEEIRLLSNQEYQEYGVMSIFLVGQPELNERLAHDRLLPLRQRIGIRFHLTPFSRDDTWKYILFRLSRAGGQHGGLFSDEAVDAIHAASRGVPRLINIICDQALLAGYADGVPEINRAMILACVREMTVPGEEAALPMSEPQAARPGRWRRPLLLLLLLALLVYTVSGAPGSGGVVEKLLRYFR